MPQLTILVPFELTLHWSIMKSCMWILKERLENDEKSNFKTFATYSAYDFSKIVECYEINQMSILGR